MLKNTEKKTLKNTAKYCKILKYILKVLENTENIEYNWPILKKTFFSALIKYYVNCKFSKFSIYPLV